MVTTMKSHGLPPEKPARLSAETRRQLTHCVRLLTATDEERRRAFAAHVREAVHAASRSLIIDRLVKVLGTDGEATRAQAAASLADLGPAALSGLKAHLLRARSPRLQARLAALLARIARRHPACADFDLMVTVELALHRARDATARQAILDAVTEV
jgi:hypothetical protein